MTNFGQRKVIPWESFADAPPAVILAASFLIHLSFKGLGRLVL
jgi:hypothetical protein